MLIGRLQILKHAPYNIAHTALGHICRQTARSAWQTHRGKEVAVDITLHAQELIHRAQRRHGAIDRGGRANTVSPLITLVGVEDDPFAQILATHRQKAECAIVGRSLSPLKKLLHIVPIVAHGEWRVSTLGGDVVDKRLYYFLVGHVVNFVITNLRIFL